MATGTAARTSPVPKAVAPAMSAAAVAIGAGAARPITATYTSA
ncbi:hypothetical protein [Kitasatospora sp. DSM 101779]|nr:hypothetical protein [Kitasatospora sp. DSM 101779]